MVASVIGELCRTSVTGSSERRRHSRQEETIVVHGHLALPSLQNGGDQLKIFALEQRSLSR